VSGWIGVDLDGTLAEYDHWRGANHIGAPIAPMVARVKGWLAEGHDVRIFTARVWSDPHVSGRSCDSCDAEEAIVAWCREHLGNELPVTCMKDYGMVELWDDRAVQVIPNTGLRADEAFAKG
jgi:hypothetical protein